MVKFLAQRFSGSLSIFTSLTDLFVRLFQPLDLSSLLFDSGPVAHSLPSQITVDSLVIEISEPLDLFLQLDNLYLFVTLLVNYFNDLFSRPFLVSLADGPSSIGSHRDVGG